VRDLKKKALKNPSKNLFPDLHPVHPEINEIFLCIKKLKYESCPDYELIRQKLCSVRSNITRQKEQTNFSQREQLMQ
jgi:hypothetical protein